jgi:hypothetical protein
MGCKEKSKEKFELHMVGGKLGLRHPAIYGPYCRRLDLWLCGVSTRDLIDCRKKSSMRGTEVPWID